MGLLEAVSLDADARALTAQDLKICPALKKEADELEEVVIRLRAKLVSGRQSSLSHAPRAKNAADNIAPMLGSLEELEAMYAAKAAAFYEHIRCVEAAIAVIWKPEIRRVIRMKYIDGLTWEQIADATCYDERWCRELGRRGLGMLGLCPKPR